MGPLCLQRRSLAKALSSLLERARVSTSLPYCIDWLLRGPDACSSTRRGSCLCFLKAQSPTRDVLLISATYEPAKSVICEASDFVQIRLAAHARNDPTRTRGCPNSVLSLSLSLFLFFPYSTFKYPNWGVGPCPFSSWLPEQGRHAQIRLCRLHLLSQPKLLSLTRQSKGLRRK